MATIKDKSAAKSKKSAKKSVAAKARVTPKASVAGTARVAPKAGAAPAAKTAAKPSRAMAGKTAKAKAPAPETRRSKVAVSKGADAAAAVEAVEKPAMRKVGSAETAPATVAVNAKLAEIARTNMNAGLDLVSDLASAKSPMEAMRLGLAYWYDNIGVFRAQAQDLRTLSVNLVTIANEPIRESASRA